MREWIELSSQGIQGLAVLIIAVSIVFGSVRYLLQLSRRVPHPYRSYKELLGRSLLLALELLVAADVIRTVLLDLTAKGMEILGALVVVRTFLSWSLVVELEGRWPWQPAVVATQTDRAQAIDDHKGVSEAVGDRAAQWTVEVPVPPTT